MPVCVMFLTLLFIFNIHAFKIRREILTQLIGDRFQLIGEQNFVFEIFDMLCTCKEVYCNCLENIDDINYIVIK